nr:MAG TPA: hypothetical protein [Caudoviricetes sp.]
MRLVNSSLMQKIDMDSKTIETIVKQIVDKEVGFIDEYINNIKQALDEEDLSIEELNRILIRLCIFSFHIAERQELIGVRSDIAEMLHKEVYNNNFLDSVGTIAKKQSLAEEMAKEEAVVSIVYNKAYKILKNRRDSIDRFADAVKKVIQSKIVELGRS